MSGFNPKGAIAIVGAGSPGLFRTSPDTPIMLAEKAVSAALADAGLDRKKVDGLIIQIGSPRGADYDLAASMLGLKTRFNSQQPGATAASAPRWSRMPPWHCPGPGRLRARLRRLQQLQLRQAWLQGAPQLR